MNNLAYGFMILFAVIVVMKYNKCKDDECNKICDKVNDMCIDACHEAEKDLEERGDKFSSARPDHADNNIKETFVDVDPDLSNWQEQLKTLSLEPGVEKSHKEFISGTLKRTSPASNWTTRDDTNEINPRHGLTIPRYDGNFGTLGKSARDTPTENADQMKRYNVVRWGSPDNF